MIRERATTRDGAFKRAQELADRHNKEIFVHTRTNGRSGLTTYLVGSERRVSGWGWAGVVISQAMLDDMG